MNQKENMKQLLKEKENYNFDVLSSNILSSVKYQAGIKKLFSEYQSNINL
jgi:hypothetical protein